MSEPLVPFRETILNASNSAYAAELPPPWNDTDGLCDARNGSYRFTSGVGASKVAVTMRSFAMPIECAAMMEKRKTSHEKILTGTDTAAVEFWKQFCDILVEKKISGYVDRCLLGESGDCASTLSRVVAFGPHAIGPNMLLLSPHVCAEVHRTLESLETGSHSEESLFASYSHTSSPSEFLTLWSRFKGAVLSAFQMVACAGPLMQEQLFGVCLAVEKVEVIGTCGDSGVFVNGEGVLDVSRISSTSTGQLISASKEGILVSMLSAPLRVVEPIYRCEMQCDQVQLGSLYGVLAKRRGLVIDADVIEGTSLFVVTASLPVASSFGFAQELLKKTSGSATTPQLFFSHWQVMEEDPFWKPRSVEELEGYGEGGRSEHSLPRIYIDSVRKRKGLPVEEKLVKNAEKQRNISKNK